MTNGLAAFAVTFLLGITWPSLHVNSLGRDLHDDPGLGRPERERFPFVRSGELVDVLVGALEDHLRPTLDREHVAVWLVAVVHNDRAPRVAFQVPGFKAVHRSVEVDVSPVGFDPDQGGFRAPLGHYGGAR